jgi:hypothetical protein
MKSSTLTKWAHQAAAATIVVTALSALPAEATALDAPSGHAVTLAVPPTTRPAGLLGLKDEVRSKIPPGFLPDMAFDGGGNLLVAWEDGSLVSIAAGGTVTELPRAEQSFARGPVALTADVQAFSGTKPSLWLRTGRGATASLQQAALPRMLQRSDGRSARPLQVAADEAGGAWIATGVEWVHWVDGRALADGRVAHEIQATLALAPEVGGALLLHADGSASLVGGSQPKTLSVTPGTACAFSGDSAALSPRRLLLGCTNGTILVADLALLRISPIPLPTAQGPLVPLGGGGGAFVDQSGVLTLVPVDQPRRPLVEGAPALPSVGTRGLLVPLSGGALAVATRAGEVFLVDEDGRFAARAESCEGVLAGAFDAATDRLALACADGTLVSFKTKAP